MSAGWQLTHGGPGGSGGGLWLEAGLVVDGLATRFREGHAAGAPILKQEAEIARLARDGLSNAEIGARVFISPRTVEYHLHKVSGKLDISARNELDRVLPSEPNAAQPV
jgi:DNA-binding NarL/FixJ family response regulator